MQDPIETLERLFTAFPGIGKRQARRFVYFLLRRGTSFIKELRDALQQLDGSVVQCKECHRFFSDDSNDKKICAICSDTKRDNTLLLVVAHDVDFQNIEHSSTYTGKYFILGGTVPVLEKEPEKKIRIQELQKNIEKQEPKEVILALSTNPEGENTRQYVIKALTKSKKSTPFKISTLGRGLSTGAELEYSDPDTIKNALVNRN